MEATMNSKAGPYKIISHADNSSFIAVHKSKERVEVWKKANGEPIFTDDYEMDGMLYAYGVPSKYVFAYVRDIDVSEAEKAEGVVCVVTHRDIPGDILMGEDYQDQYIFVRDRALTTGDIVALIVADTPEHAKAAGSLVKVDYDPQKPLTDIDSALASDQVINPYKPTNLCSSCFIRKGEPEEERPADEVTVKAHYETTWQEQAYLETECVIGIPGQRENVKVFGNMQGLYNEMIDINRSLLIPMSRISIQAPAIGGSFGGKLESSEIMAVRVAAAALKCGKPVKYMLNREESMQQSHKRHPFVFDTEFSAKKDGTFTCMKWNSWADGGPYGNMTPGVIFKAVSLGAGPYVVPNVYLDSKGAYTNNITSGSMRGFGNPQGIYARECTIDELAEKLQMSPYLLRKKNVMHRGDATGSGQIIDFEDVGAEEVLDEVAKKLDFENKYWNYRKENPGKTKRRGVGLSLSYRGNSYGTGVPDMGRCHLDVKADGSALLSLGMTELGQGLTTTMIQLTAEALGISDTEVSFNDCDTTVAPPTSICNASRGTLVGGRAILDAAKHVHECIKDAMVEQFGCDRSSITFAKDEVRMGDRVISWKEAVKITYSLGMTPAFSGSFKTPDPVFNAETGFGDTFWEYTYSCIGAEVEVDICTGEVKVLQIVAGHDPGRVMNPKLADGQAIGGAVMAQGYALTEDIRSVNGIAQHVNLDEYMIPTIMDIPMDMSSIFVENPNDRGPYGARSLGEPSLDPGLGAFVNAVNCALGELGKVRCNPVNLHKVIFNTKV